jgi:hypothetical protein
VIEPAEAIMLSLLIVLAVAGPLMLWALSPGRRRKAGEAVHPPVDAASLPPAASGGGFSFGSSCDGGGGGCDGGGG